MRRLAPGPGPEVTIEFEGKPLPAYEGEPAACALLAAGEVVLSRSVKYHRPRGPYCMAASCSHCLMRIDGTPNRFACQTPVRAGMRLERQNAYPSARVDVFASIDWLFPRGLDHHAMFAGVPVADKVMATVARHLAGLGLLPEAAPAQRRPPERLEVEVAIVGAGAAGLSAAEVLGADGQRLLLLDREDSVGGRWILDAPEPEAIAMPSPPRSAEVRLATTVLGLYDDELGRMLVAVQQGPEGPRLLFIKTRAMLFALGGYASVLPFENNDIPGVFSGRAASDLLRRRELLVGEAPIIVGHGAQLLPLARLFQAKGAQVATIVETSGNAAVAESVTVGVPTRAHGRTWVQGLSIRGADGRERRVACDAIVVSQPPSPAFELLRQAGVKVAFRPELQSFAPVADPDGRTAVPGVWAAGDVVAPGTLLEATESGRQVARAMLGELR
jgi:sarcosine oxidase, subunit alpha